MAKDTETKVVEAVEKLDQDEDDNLIILSTGVVLKGRAAPALALIKVMSSFPRPKPPTYMNKTMGREMENPDDPDYLERVQAHQTESTAALLNALILLGTEIESTPKKFPKPESDEWVDEYREVGLDPKPENKRWRYLNWVIFKAAPKADDMQAIQKVVGKLSGVPEGAVQDAEEFPGDQ